MEKKIYEGDDLNVGHEMIEDLKNLNGWMLPKRSSL